MGVIKKEKILEVAKDIFLEKGYKETKIADIAKAAGISPATIYLYFKGKKSLFDTLHIPEAKDFHPQYESKRTEIIHAALIMFGEKGFNGTSLDMIAKQIGYSKASLYQYFENKEALFSAVMKETPFYFSFMDIKPKIDNYDLYSLIHEIGMSYMNLFNTPERIAFTRIIIWDSNKHSEVSDTYHKYGIGYVAQCVVECLKKFEDQLRSDVDLYLAAKTYVGSLFAFAIQYKVIIGVSQTYSDQEIVELSTDIFIRGIKKS